MMLMRKWGWLWLIAAGGNFSFLLWIFLEGRWLISNGEPVTHDFLPIWSAAKYAFHGQSRLIYAPMEGTGDLPFLHPPYILALLLPFGAISYTASAVAFLFVSAFAYVSALNLILRDRVRSVLLALAGGGALFNIWYIQIGFFTAALMVGGLALMRRSPNAAGILFGLLTIKPQMGLALALMLLITRQWRVISVALITALLLVGLSLICFGPDIWRDYINFASHANPLVGGSNWFKMQSLFSALRRFTGIWAAAIIHGAVAIAALAVMARLWLFKRDFETSAAATIAATLLVTPYLFTYDAVMLTGAAAFMTIRRLHNADMVMAILSCPLLSGPSTMRVWTKEGRTNAEQEADAGADHWEAARSGDRGGARCHDRRGVPPDRGQRADLLSLAQGVRRSED